MLVGAPLIFLLWLATSISRGVGDAVSPMWALILATGVALLCTPALIAGWTGLPRLDVLSPAVSTLLGFTLALGWGAVTQLMSWLQLRDVAGHQPPSWPPTPSAPDAATGWAPSPAPG